MIGSPVFWVKRQLFIANGQVLKMAERRRHLLSAESPHLRVTENRNNLILLVSQLGDVVASMAQYGQYGTLEAAKLPSRYPTQF
ncbi:hypothetical protein [Desulfogranum japonicum]|uniref:hypothetical protein n=1 Tax=Desulfogranum japonicum TaxID=231447 RepID=UPI00048E3F17|nr:hypothetical protein [Desulfogranum japonicum]